MAELDAVVAAFESAARSLDACRILLLDMVRPEAPTDGCSHADAIKIASFGAEQTRLCPDCDETLS